MGKVKVLIIDDSFIVTNGLQQVLNDITEISYLSVGSDFTSVNQVIVDFTPDILILRNSSFNKFKKLLTESNYAFVLMGETNELIAKYFINLLSDDKSKIISVVRNSITDRVDKDIVTKNDELSAREESVVKCIAKGFTNQEIADELFLSKHTVITHRKNITNKLNIKTVSGLTVYAILNNIIDINEVN